MTEAKHTSTPWSEFCESGFWWIQQVDDKGNPTGTQVCDAESMTADDMLFIVKAVNNHEKLVNFAKAVKYMSERREHPPGGVLLPTFIEMADEVLANTKN